MKSTDMVSLIAVVRKNHVWMGWMTARAASDLIRGWWNSRECVYRGADPEEQDKAREHLAKGTLVTNISVEDEEESVAMSAVAWSEVVGLYVELRTSPQEKMVELMEKGMSSELPGDEWKKGGEEL